jgi:S-adenosylmethionine hydrolase
MKPPCGVVTITTDFGIEDSYVGTMKGVALRIYPEVRLVDITHQVKPQDVLEASLILENAYPFFPVGSVHLAVVDPGVGTDRRPLLVATDECYFVGPDNGIFTRILESKPVEAIIHLVNPCFRLASISGTFHGRDVFAPAAAYLARGVAPAEFGPPVDDAVRVDASVPRIYPDQICGEVIYVDSFGNIVTNISRKQFTEVVGESRMRITINGKKIEQIVRSYMDGERGKALALFGSSDLLEIAVAGGRADRRIGAGKGDTVLVDVLRIGSRPQAVPGFDL